MGLLDDLNDGPNAAAAPDFRVAVILPAAGRGERFGGGGADAGLLGSCAFPGKIELLLDARPVFMHAVSAFCGRADVVQVILAVAPDRLNDFNARHGTRLDDLDVTRVAGGTADRWQTVARALAHVDPAATHIAVHDAARPLVEQTLIDRVFAAAARFDAVVPGLPVSDTLVRAGDAVPSASGGRAEAILGWDDGPAAEVRPVTGGLDRAGVFAVQTPQVFAAALLRRAYALAGRADDPAAGATDDASRVAALGETVHLVNGDEKSLKITRPGDVELLEALLANRRAESARRAADGLLADDEDD